MQAHLMNTRNKMVWEAVTSNMKYKHLTSKWFRPTLKANSIFALQLWNLKKNKKKMQGPVNFQDLPKTAYRGHYP